MISGILLLIELPLPGTLAFPDEKIRTIKGLTLG